MRIKYLQLHQPLALPGQGTGKKWSANGLDGRESGMVRSIVESDKGYLMEIAVGPHRGFYDVLDHAVQFACKEPAPIESATTGAEPQPQKKTKPAKA